MKKTNSATTPEELRRRIELIEYHLKVLECDHNAIEFKTDRMWPGWNVYYSECSNCGKKLAEYENEIEWQTDKVAYTNRRVGEESERLATLLNEGKKEE